jgi:hypothetical protein
MCLPHMTSFPIRRLRPGGGPVCAGQARCADAVRGCPCGRAARSLRARTYSGQRRYSGHHPVALAQVRWYVEVQAGEYCKTVGSAYVGSNPTPATTCGNGPLAANSRAGGPFLLGPGVCHLVALQIVILRCPRTHSRRASVLQGRSVCTVRTVGVHSCGGRCAPSAFPRTATDGRAGGVFGWRRTAEPGVHPGWQTGGPRAFPGQGRPGRGW